MTRMGAKWAIVTSGTKALLDGVRYPYPSVPPLETPAPLFQTPAPCSILPAQLIMIGSTTPFGYELTSPVAKSSPIAFTSHFRNR